MRILICGLTLILCFASCEKDNDNDKNTTTNEVTAIEGCTNPNACNYNASAEEDDGSCDLTPGCTLSTALNYNPEACVNDGSCIFCEEDETRTDINDTEQSLIDNISNTQNQGKQIAKLTFEEITMSDCENGNWVMVGDRIVQVRIENVSDVGFSMNFDVNHDDSDQTAVTNDWSASASTQGRIEPGESQEIFLNDEITNFALGTTTFVITAITY